MILYRDDKGGIIEAAPKKAIVRFDAIDGFIIETDPDEFYYIRLEPSDTVAEYVRNILWNAHEKRKLLVDLSKTEAHFLISETISLTLPLDPNKPFNRINQVMYKSLIKERANQKARDRFKELLKDSGLSFTIIHSNDSYDYMKVYYQDTLLYQGNTKDLENDT